MNQSRIFFHTKYFETKEQKQFYLSANKKFERYLNKEDVILTTAEKRILIESELVADKLAYNIFELLGYSISEKKKKLDIAKEVYIYQTLFETRKQPTYLIMRDFVRNYKKKEK